MRATNELGWCIALVGSPKTGADAGGSTFKKKISAMIGVGSDHRTPGGKKRWLYTQCLG